MSLIRNIFFCLILLGGASSFPNPPSSHGRCGGEAVNYLVSVSSHRDCLDACNNDERCCYYSHHRSDESHPDHDNCYLYSATECDTEDLIYSEPGSDWRTGDRSRTEFSSLCPRSEVFRWFTRC